MKPSIKDKNKLCTIYSGIDFKKFDIASSTYLKLTFKVPEGLQNHGNVSAIAPHKDYYTFIDTAKLLLDAGVKAKFFVIGDGSERRKIEQYAAEHNLLDAIYFVGFVKHIIPILNP